MRDAFMEAAIQEGRDGLHDCEVPIDAALVKEGRMTSNGRRQGVVEG